MTPRDERGRPGAVVIGLDCITGLQTARLLARRGVRVIGLAADPTHPACRTNTCHRLVKTALSGDALCGALRWLSETEAGAALVPCTDAAVLTVATHIDELGGFRAVLPPADVVETLMAKDRFADHADRHGLPVPASQTVTTVREAAAAADALRFPLVVKPALKTPRWEAAGPKVHRFMDPVEWMRSVGDLLRLSPRLLAQEWVAGGDDCLYSCNVYVPRDGAPIRTFVARKLRQWPPAAGTSSLGEAVLDEGIRELALKTLATVPFVGLGYVEIKRDARTREDRLIEVNVGRPTGRSAIAEAGGVELLHAMYCDATDQPAPPLVEQDDRPVKWMHVSRDMRAAITQLRTGELSLGEWASSLRGPMVFADLDRDDPWPVIATAERGARSLVRRKHASSRMSS